MHRFNKDEVIMGEDIFKINLTVDNEKYPLSIRRDDEILYREAAKTVDKALLKYRSAFPELGSNKHWAMAALELAFLVVSRKNTEDYSPYKEKLLELTKEIEKYIDKE